MGNKELMAFLNGLIREEPPPAVKPLIDVIKKNLILLSAWNEANASTTTTVEVIEQTRKNIDTMLAAIAWIESQKPLLHPHSHMPPQGDD